LSPKRIIVGKKADPDIDAIAAHFHRKPVILRPLLPVA
jgi:hypothetical protein